MAHSIVGRGLTFPLGINSQGGFALTSFRSELEQAIAIILATTPGERVMRPRFGSRLNELLYEPNNSRTAALAEQYVEDALAMWEPRIRVIGVT
ncbi:MAG: GPW/gp25 family protein, partial [Anaerolineales bacterium]|nr:GPW/gp25 family protein [Anaerolineales bacterium]